MHICPSPLLPYVQCQGSSPKPCAFWADAIPDLSSSPTQCFLMFSNILCHVSFLSNCTFIFLWLVKLYHVGWGGHFTHILRTCKWNRGQVKGENQSQTFENTTVCMSDSDVLIMKLVAGGLTELSLLLQLDWMATKPQESWLHLPYVGITGAYCCAWLFYVGARGLNSGPHHLTDEAIFLASWWTFLYPGHVSMLCTC